jgi:RNA polymerase sigma-54 factor
MAKNTFSQSQTQQQALTQSLSPQQVLFARLLELTTVEVEERVRGEVMDNPALEAVEPESLSDAAALPGGDEAVSSLDDYRSDDDVPPYYGWDYRSDSAPDIPVSDAQSFGDTLLEQLNELLLSPQEQLIGEYLIGSLEDDGLLRKPLSEIEDELLLYSSIAPSEQEIEDVLKKIQAFEPAGIAARSLQECLMLQLQRNGSQRDLSLHKRIISDYYEDFTKKHWDALPEKLSVSREECREAIADIARLNPRPGASLVESIGLSRQQIVPDFNIEVQGDEVSVSLNNQYVPDLRVSNEYENMLVEQSRSGSSEHRAAAQFLKQKIDAAKGFIAAVKQREETLVCTMQAIVSAQKAFFVGGGDEALLVPMILEDIAARTGYDVSTISRVSNSKYAQLPWGIYPLKFFLSDGVATADGGERSVRELYAALQELVDGEDKAAPLTDEDIMERLRAQGFSLARRTVAKYREHLHIPVARLRKE